MNRSLVLVIGLAGCAAGTYIYPITIQPPPHAMAPRPPQSVEVYSSGRPERPFVDVAYLEAAVNSYEGLDNVVGDLRTRAAAMGCDGIIFNGRDAKLQFAATCIVFR
jgi:hypothetical protein